MRDRTSVTTDAAGRRVMAKLAGNAEEASRLEREVRQLQAAKHPGVVELIGIDGHGMGSIMLTAHVDGPTLGRVGRLPIEEGAGLIAALATTLADLHDLGLVHGAMAPEHVLIGPGGRPVLCSLGYGGRVGEPLGESPPLAGAFVDPARASVDGLTPALDVFGLGALARAVAPSPPAGHPLARVADDATHDDPDRRPSARAVAELLQRDVPAARLPRGLPSPAPPAGAPVTAPADPLAAWRRQGGILGVSRRPQLSGRVFAVGAVAAVAVAGVALFLTRTPATTSPTLATEHAEPAADSAEPPLPDEEQPGPPTTRAGLTSSSSSTTLTTVVRRDCPAATAVLQADVDGDGCPEALRYANGILESGERRWSLGQPGDQVATGDWGCQGVRTLALFRPLTGEIFRFDRWAEPGRDVTASAVARVTGGQALRAADVDRDGCHEAVVERGSGVAEVVRLPRVQP